MSVDEEAWANRELVILCWTVLDRAVPLHAHYVRIDFECAFVVSEMPQTEGGTQLLYRYVQRSRPKVLLVPDSLLLSSQCAILLKEVEGLRREAAREDKKR